MVQNDVLKNIKEKLKEDSNCDLTISELEVLSKCDYETIVQIFGKDSVARTPEEITINTICYLGDLAIKELLPTYNLKYIFGNLGIRISNINLDNLKFVRNSLYISRKFNYEELGLDELLDNKSYMLYAVKRCANELGYASEELKNDKEVVLEAIRQNGALLTYASDELKNNKEIVLEAVRTNGYALQYASNEFQKDKEVVLEAVRQNGYALQYASNEFQKDKEVVLEAIKQNDYALYFASENLQHYFKKHGIEIENEQKDDKRRFK